LGRVLTGVAVFLALMALGSAAVRY